MLRNCLVSRFEHLDCYATVLCLSIWTHGECYATVLRNCLASLDLNTWCVLRNCLVSRYLNTWMLRNCLVSLDLNTWWMLCNCFTQLSCVSRFEHMVCATQLSLCLDLNTWMLRNCLVSLDLNTWWMLRNCLTQLSCVSRFEHMVCYSQVWKSMRFQKLCVLAWGKLIREGRCDCCVQVVFLYVGFQSIATFCSYYVWMYSGDWCPLVALYMCDFLIHLDILQPNTCLVPCTFLDRLLHFGMWCTNMAMDIDQVLMGWDEVMWLVATPVLLCTAKYYSSTTQVLLQYYKVRLQCYSSTTKYYNVLLQYYSVLQSTTTYYSSTALYYQVLLQYDSVLQSTSAVLLRTTTYYSSTTPVLLRTTTYYSSTTPYYNVLLQYFSVRQSTTPVLLCTIKYYSQYYSVLQSTTPVLLCTDSNAVRRAWCSYLPRRGVFNCWSGGVPSFEYLVTSFTTSFIPRSRPRSLPLQKACFQAAISKQFPLNMIVLVERLISYASDVRPIVFCNFWLINSRCFWTFF